MGEWVVCSQDVLEMRAVGLQPRVDAGQLDAQLLSPQREVLNTDVCRGNEHEGDVGDSVTPGRARLGSPRCVVCAAGSLRAFWHTTSPS